MLIQRELFTKDLSTISSDNEKCLYRIIRQILCDSERKMINEFVLPAKNVDRQGIKTETNENQYWLDN